MIAIQQQQKESATNYKAMAWTIGIHVLLLLLCMFVYVFIFPPPDAPVDDGGGMEVNLGTSDNGSGTDQPMRKGDPGAYQATVVYKPVPTQNNIPKTVFQGNDADAPAVSNKDNKAIAQPDAKAKADVPKKELPKYTYGGDNGPGGNSATQNAPGSNEGNTTGPGDRGVPGGTPGAPNYTGTPGNGTGGIGHTLSGRSISPDKFEAEFSESGKVVIRVTVDRNGNIVDKRIKSSSSPQLTRLAIEKINHARFSPSSGPEPQQFGDVTIIFKTRQ